jgi:hypothetical protein
VGPRADLNVLERKKKNLAPFGPTEEEVIGRSTGISPKRAVHLTVIALLPQGNNMDITKQSVL